MYSIKSNGIIYQSSYPRSYEKKWLIEQKAVWIPERKVHSATATQGARPVDHSRNVDAIYMDFQKACDKVPHKCLSKLREYGMGGLIEDWVSNFVTGRKHKVCINGIASTLAEVTSGISQGSILGPVLFVLYINDPPDVVKNEVYLFANDTKIYCDTADPANMVCLQEDLNSLKEWSDKWLLAFHHDKCKILRLGNRAREPYDYKLGLISLVHVDLEKDLGVTIPPGIAENC